MSIQYQYVKDSRHHRKENILYVMGEKCFLCGYNKSKTALELHHLNPDNKDFTIGQCLNKSWDTLNKEIQKCVLLCANCHREIHEGLVTKELTSSYIKERADEITEKIQLLRTKTYHYCQNCNAIISEKAIYCEKCANLERRIIERPSREELKDMIRIMPFTQIAVKYNISDNAIRKWCKSYNLPSRKKDINSYSDEEWEKI